MGRRADAGGTWSTRPGDPTLRVGDAERNEVAEALSQHFSDGRLDQAELKERLDQAMSAKTGADLSGLLADLPPLPGQRPPSAPAPRHRRGAGAWLVVGLVFLALMAVPWGRGPWFPWMWFPRIPWILIGIVAFVLWRRSRRRHWRSDVVS